MTGTRRPIKIRGAAWGLLLWVVGDVAVGHAVDVSGFDAGKMILPAERYQQLQAPGIVTIEGRALCAAMRLPQEFPCDASTILDAARQQTDPALWIDRTISGSDQDAPEYCRNPVLLEILPAKDGGTNSYVLGCHPAPEADTITPEMIDRLAAAAKTLHTINPKTLAQHKAEERLVRYIEALEDEAK